MVMVLVFQGFLWFSRLGLRSGLWFSKCSIVFQVRATVRVMVFHVFNGFPGYMHGQGCGFPGLPLFSKVFQVRFQVMVRAAIKDLNCFPKVVDEVFNSFQLSMMSIGAPFLHRSARSSRS